MRTVLSPSYSRGLSFLPAVRAKRKTQAAARSVQHRYPAYAKDCLDPETAGSTDRLTGKKLTQEEIAALETRKKERDAQ
jgi:hypothetical protein